MWQRIEMRSSKFFRNAHYAISLKLSLSKIQPMISQNQVVSSRFNTPKTLRKQKLSQCINTFQHCLNTVLLLGNGYS